MNKVERRALDTLDKKEKEKIAKDLKETDELTNEQCENLRSAVRNLSEEKQNELANSICAVNEEEQMQVAGGSKVTDEIKRKTDLDDVRNTSDFNDIIMIRYGGPGFYKHNRNNQKDI